MSAAAGLEGRCIPLTGLWPRAYPPVRTSNDDVACQLAPRCGVLLRPGRRWVESVGRGAEDVAWWAPRPRSAPVSRDLESLVLARVEALHRCCPFCLRERSRTAAPAWSPTEAEAV